MKRSIEFNLKPNWDEIEKIRNESIGFLQSHELSDDTIHSLSMIISELIENGIKYGNFKMIEKSVVVIINIERNTVTIEVLNPVDDNAFNHLSRLDKTIQWIRGYQDPFEAYIERIKEVSKKPLNDKESGIGLVRIAYEGKALLDFFVADNNMLNVSVVSNIEGK
ncbi:ATP-binding protein [Desulfosarcina sp.]|uniref:ATP-binding protein n=1 Tax=Desulfosarcina sp. TaxID=2027861 RepID=UPI0035685FE0